MLIDNDGPETSAQETGEGYGAGTSRGSGSPGVVILDLIGGEDSTPETTSSPGPSSTSNTPTFQEF